MAVKLRERSEIPEQYKWDAASVYPSKDDWEAEVQYVEGKLPELAKFQGRLGEGPQTLLDWFKAAEDVGKRVGKILVYATLHYTVDTQDQEAAAMNDRARGLMARAMAAGAFAEPEILSIGLDTLKRWMQEEPKLAVYEHYLDRLYRRQEHIRSPEVEELLSQVMDPFRTAASVHGVLSDADLQFKPAQNSKGETFEIAQGTIGKLLADPDRELRRTAWENYEVASNFNQALVRDYLLRTQKDRDFQIAVIEEAMANFHRYFFIMPALARFEHEIHERVWRGQPLTAQGLIELMAQLFEEGFGGEVELDKERVGITWAQFPTHLYANFYVYQYATGISGAHALAERVLAGEPGAAERYVEFLKAGGSLYPLDALKRAGVDLTSPEPVEQAFGVLERYVKRLEELTAQRRG